MFSVCVGPVADSKYVQFCTISSLDINTVEVDPYSDSRHNGMLKPKNCNQLTAHLMFTLLTVLQKAAPSFGRFFRNIPDPLHAYVRVVVSDRPTLLARVPDLLESLLSTDLDRQSGSSFELPLPKKTEFWYFNTSNMYMSIRSFEYYV